MRFYSNTTALFLKRAKLLLKDILSSEMGLKVYKSRFQWKRHLYPINLVVFEKGNTLGFFEPHGYQIGLSKRLLFGTKEPLIKDVLRHEMAHFWTYLEKGNLDHGPNFREVCRRFRWSETVKNATVDLTKENDGMFLNLALNYGGRAEIVRATKRLCKKILQKKISLEQIDEETFAENLDAGKALYPDLIIRTAGERRLSNFLLWQSAYSELHFSEKTWPDFSKKDLELALTDYLSRTRKFGGLSEKIS